MLDGQQRVALLAHELGHLAHRDPRRGRVVALGLQALVRWWLVLVPPPRPSRGALLQPASEALLTVLRAIVRMWARAIGRLQLGAVQRAELRSDRAGAAVAGYDAYAGLLDQLHLVDRLASAARVAIVRRDGVDFTTSVVEAMRSLPGHERERLRRLTDREPYDRLASHPPLRLRRRAVDDLRAEAGTVVPTAGRWRTIDEELAPAASTVVERAAVAHRKGQDRFTGRRPALADRPAGSARRGRVG